jgi:hypothetical protein
MKKNQFRVAFIIFALVLLSSCKKSPLDNPQYIGEWYGVTTATEQFVDIYSDGTGSFYFYKGGSVSSSGKVRITKSHLKIGNSNFDIVEPPTQIDTTFEFGKLISWEIQLQYTEIFTSGEYMHLYKK